MRKQIILLLTAALVITSVPQSVMASVNTTSDNEISDEINLEDTVSDNEAFDEMHLKDTTSDNAVSEHTISEDVISEDTVSDNTVSEDTVSGNKELPRSICFSTTYSNNVNAGEKAYIDFTGIKNGEGKKRVYFTIEKRPLDEVSVHVAPCQYQDQKEVRPEVSVFYDDYKLTEGIEYDIEYENNVNVTTSDMTQAQKPTVIIQAREGEHINFKGTKKVTFDILGKSLSELEYGLLDEKEVYSSDGVTAFEPQIYVKDQSATLTQGKDYQVRYYNNVKPGAATIEINGIGTYAGTVEIPFVIQGGKELGKLSFEKIPDQIYQDGQPIRPAVTVKDATGNPLSSDSYSVVYENNSKVGKATAYVMGTGAYRGCKVLTFQIKKEKLNSDHIEVKFSAPMYSFNSLLQKPELTVKNTETGITLKENQDYKVSYSKNKNAGTAKVVLTGKGSYTGKRNETFVIEPIDLHTSSFNIHVEDVKYNGKAQKPKVTVMFTAPSNKEIKLVKGKDYQVEYYDHTGSPTQDTEGYVKITGLGNYCGTIGDAGEETCKFRMIHNRLASEFQISGIHNCVYNGEEQTFRNADGDCTLSVTCKGKTLVEGTDFKVSYLDHVNVGKATVLIQGIGDYAGTAKKYFRIKPADFLAAYQSGDLYIDYYEDGGLPNYITNQLWYLLEENVSLRYRYSYLEPGRDYRIVMKNFNKTGPGKICFVGKGNFKGTVVILENLYAEACNIGNYRVKINQNQTIYYTGKAIKPLVQLNEYAYDIPSDFYQTKVEKGINAGNYSYEITLNEKLFDTRDSYIKTKKGTYEIKPRNIEETKISPIAAQTYQGVAVTPKVSIKFGSLKLKQGVDYTVSYQNNHARTCDSSESAYVVIKGIGNFSGETRTSFVIK